MRGAVVLNTRPPDQGAELSRLLAAAGLTPLEVPATDIVPGWNPAELGVIDQRLRAGEYAWLVLQSQNAARCVVAGLSGDLGDVSILCGAATAGHLQGLAVHRDRVRRLVRFSADAALAELRPQLAPGQRVLVPRAANGRDELIEGLRAMEVVVDAPVCYVTRPRSPAALRAALGASLARGDVHAITLCSPSAVDALRAAFPTDVLDRPAVVCLGETTAAAARRVGWRVDRVASRTNMHDLVQAVQAALEVPA